MQREGKDGGWWLRGRRHIALTLVPNGKKVGKNCTDGHADVRVCGCHSSLLFNRQSECETNKARSRFGSKVGSVTCGSAAHFKCR